MTAPTFLQPNFTTMLAAAYKAAIDAAFAVHHRLAGPFAPHENNSGSPAPDMTVRVDAGFIWNGTTLTEKPAQQVTGFTIPSAGQHRIDRVVIDDVTGDARRIEGTPAAGSPSATPPAIPAGSLPCCQILINSAHTAITNDMITDERMPVPTGVGRSTIDILTNKTLNLGSNTVSGTIAQFNTAVTDADFATLAGIETLTNKTIDLTSNTLTATSLQLKTAVTDETGSGALVFATSPTLVTPALGTPASGVLTNCTGLTEAGFANSSVAQAKLKTTTGDVSTSSTTYANLTLPGGEWGFYPRTWVQTIDDTGFATIVESTAATSPTTFIALKMISGGGAAVSARQRYIQASPPYDLGNGEIPLFMFALVDSLGKIIATYVAPEPPWAYNGPTDIRADYYRDGKGFQKPRLTAQQRLDLRDPAKRDGVLAALASGADVEITHAIKNADMGLIPHPFVFNNLIGLTVVLLDAIGPFGDQMATLHGVGESIGELLHGGHLVVDYTPLSAITPQGVIACKASWK